MCMNTNTNIQVGTTFEARGFLFRVTQVDGDIVTCDPIRKVVAHAPDVFSKGTIFYTWEVVSVRPDDAIA